MSTNSAPDPGYPGLWLWIAGNSLYAGLGFLHVRP